MLAYMIRTTVKLPPELDARLRHEAARRDITISELTREAIETHLAPARRLGAAAAGRSGQSDISERIEEILAIASLPRGAVPTNSENRWHAQTRHRT